MMEQFRQTQIHDNTGPTKKSEMTNPNFNKTAPGLVKFREFEEPMQPDDGRNPFKAPSNLKMETQETKYGRDHSNSGRLFEYQKTIHSIN